MSILSFHFGPEHPLAEVVARHCRSHDLYLASEVACGECWERAIRDDERIVVECGLPREIVPDPNYVDEIAVDLACRGERVSLTPVELAVAVHRLGAKGLSPVEIARRLQLSYGEVIAVSTRPSSVGRRVRRGRAST